MKVYSSEEFPVKTEVWSRVVGYLRPVNAWNPGKVEEFRQRKGFDKALKTIKLVAKAKEVEAEA